MTDLLNREDQAARAAGSAAETAGCVVEELHQLEQLADAAAVFARIWARADGEQILPTEILRALTHAGNYAAGAYVDGHLSGAVVGFLGQHRGGWTLHSHIMGLLPAVRGRGIGFALKQHQRAWALSLGLTEVSWTFDPLVRANAYLNLTKLGAVAATYLPNFYGTMTDELNAGADSDRLLVTWELGSSRAVLASEGQATTWRQDDLVGAGAQVLLAEGSDGEPQTTAADGARLLCQVPADIVALRASRPALARDWRHAVRATLGAAIEDGYRATGVTRSGWYVLEHPPAPDDRAERT